MVRLFALMGLTTLVNACAAPRVYRYDNLGFSVSVGTQGQLLAACDVVRWDNGEKRPPGAKMNGCFKPFTREIWLEDSCEGAKALVHEMAHLDGKFGAEADEVKW